MAQRREDMRAADSDRQFVADRLRDGLNEGRLDLGEYDERLRQTYAARTYGELDKLLNDLPTVTPPERSQVAPVAAPPPADRGAARRPIQPWLIAIWGSWFVASAVCFVIWVLNGADGFPWPLWVAGPWGVLLLSRTVAALASGDPTGYARGDQERYRRRQQERWDRRHDRWERRRYR